MNLRDVLENFDNYAIFAHTSPDADAICSCLVAKKWIESISNDKMADIFLDIDEKEIPELYKDTLVEPFNKSRINKYQIAIYLDSPSSSRVFKNGYSDDDFEHIVNIDHHTSNNKFGDVNIVLPQVSSTGELLYYLMKKYGSEIDEEQAKYIYTSIITDTNCFSKISITSSTHSVVSEILKKDFNSREVKVNFFQNNSKAKIFLIQRTFGSLKFYNNYEFALMKITKKDFAITKATYEDSLGIVDNGINIEDVRICACIIEKNKNEYYISLRGKYNIDVSIIAKMFNGGGHETMAAFQYSGNIKELEHELINKITEFLLTLPIDDDDDDINDF